MPPGEWNRFIHMHLHPGHSLACPVTWNRGTKHSPHQSGNKTENTSTERSTHGIAVAMYMYTYTRLLNDDTILVGAHPPLRGSNFPPLQCRVLTHKETTPQRGRFETDVMRMAMIGAHVSLLPFSGPWLSLHGAFTGVQRSPPHPTTLGHRDRPKPTGK